MRGQNDRSINTNLNRTNSRMNHYGKLPDNSVNITLKSLNHTAGKMDVDILSPKDIDAPSKKSARFEVENSRVTT